jgi:CheY-like chemotaxis protein
MKHQPQASAILLVDDDPHIRNTMRGILEEEGWQVTLAADGREALAHLHAGLRPRVILLDLTMPGMDGAQFMARRRQEADLLQIPVYLFSATRGAAERARELGAVGLLPKPVQLEYLLSVVDQHRT